MLSIHFVWLFFLLKPFVAYLDITSILSFLLIQTVLLSLFGYNQSECMFSCIINELYLFYASDFLWLLKLVL